MFGFELFGFGLELDIPEPNSNFSTNPIQTNFSGLGVSFVIVSYNLL